MYHQLSLEVPAVLPTTNRRSSRQEITTSEISCSKQSILNAMDRFVKSVAEMDSTVLVPSRLRDLEPTSGGRLAPPAGVRSSDLHSLFFMLHDVKNELLWSAPGSRTAAGGLQLAFNRDCRLTAGDTYKLLGAPLSPGSPLSSRQPSLGQLQQQLQQQHPQHLQQSAQQQQSSFGPRLRVPSVGSLTGGGAPLQQRRRFVSTGSLASALSDVDTDSDSLCGDAAAADGEDSTQLANTFRLHLHGLHAILQQLADSADFLSARYQEDIEPSPL